MVKKNANTPRYIVHMPTVADDGTIIIIISSSQYNCFRW